MRQGSHSPSRAPRLHRLFLLAAALILSSCQDEQPPEREAPAEVSVIRLRPESVSISDLLPGRVVAFRTAEIRPQVGGVIRESLFRQGSEVAAGQPLFQLDPAPFAAETAMAAAALQRTESVLSRAEIQVGRIETLLKTHAASRQAHEDALALRAQAAADVAQSRAALERRRLDLGFTTIRSPIAGRIDQALASEGALAVVSTSPLAVVQQIDRVYIDLRQPARRLDELRDLARAGSRDDGATVEILSGDGQPYPVTGKLLFSGIGVDPGTSEVIVRVEAANPERFLLPGMFVRARLPRERRSDALLVPLQAVKRDGNGIAQVALVADDGQMRLQTITTGAEVDGRIVIESGLSPGDQVIVEGQDRLQPGMQVKAMPWRAERIAGVDPQR
ncbi:efflux RND transporter periplasmic adaptor subunit [Chelatococcus asaccharovorans]|uniref:efflux RND transporter periplasmic adaptor subunit n=1 Tax=Chelatococcus asaccharovorans TaxID=28210 RepID=UPI000D768A00|nr:efflux RND transporter periplasmic adaptor subunit [Chelatococcus asaccharovorans]MBS7706243.1 efflux RND transporter periplasmic adaptor subunit [Chelatococcus asaccharovorans]